MKVDESQNFIELSKLTRKVNGDVISCEAHNAVGVSRANITLNVIYKPQFKANDKPVMAQIGELAYNASTHATTCLFVDMYVAFTSHIRCTRFPFFRSLSSPLVTRNKYIRYMHVSQLSKRGIRVCRRRRRSSRPSRGQRAPTRECRRQQQLPLSPRHQGVLQTRAGEEFSRWLFAACMIGHKRANSKPASKCHCVCVRWETGPSRCIGCRGRGAAAPIVFDR